MSTRPRSPRGRRRFLKAVPVTIAAGLAAPGAAQPPPSSRVSKAALEAGENIAGVDFADAQEDLALRLVNANRDHYDAIRAVPLGRDVEPAFRFQPPLP